jgi:hypothetical protein
VTNARSGSDRGVGDDDDAWLRASAPRLLRLLAGRAGAHWEKAGGGCVLLHVAAPVSVSWSHSRRKVSSGPLIIPGCGESMGGSAGQLTGCHQVGHVWRGSCGQVVCVAMPPLAPVLEIKSRPAGGGGQQLNAAGDWWRSCTYWMK